MADMYTNVAAESIGRALATRLWEITEDPGMKDMLSFMIARDTMHQQQWLAVIEELGGAKGLPHPELISAKLGAREVQLRFHQPRHQGGRRNAGGPLDARPQHRRQGPVSRAQSRALRR